MKSKVLRFCKHSFKINFECKCSNHSDKKCIKNYFRYVKTILISFQLLAIYDMKNSWKEILLKKSMIFMAILALLENPY